MNENQTPWAVAAAKLKAGNSYYSYGELCTAILDACNIHASDLRAENERLRKEHDYMHRTLLNREESLKQAGNDWVKAKTETDTVKAERDALAAKVEQLRAALLPMQRRYRRDHAHNLDELPTLPTPYDELLSDAPPPAVVPLVDVEPVLAAAYALCNPKLTSGATSKVEDLRKALAAYRSKHPKPESKA